MRLRATVLFNHDILSVYVGASLRFPGLPFQSLLRHSPDAMLLLVVDEAS